MSRARILNFNTMLCAPAPARAADGICEAVAALILIVGGCGLCGLASLL